MPKKLIELKPCPFCGAPAERRRSLIGYFYIQCKNIFCGVRPYTKAFDRQSDATRAWNKRKGV